MQLLAGERSPVKAADWLEEQVVRSWNGQAYTRNIVGAMLAEGDMVVAEDGDDHDLSEKDEDRSGAGIRLADNTDVEIDRRRALCGDDYPFAFERGLLKWKVRRSGRILISFVCSLPTAISVNRETIPERFSNIWPHWRLRRFWEATRCVSEPRATRWPDRSTMP